MAGIDNNTILYLRGDSFNDLSSSPKAITNNGVTIVDKEYRFLGGSSSYFDCDITSLPNSFTLEFYFKIENTTSAPHLFSYGAANTNRIYCLLENKIFRVAHTNGSAIASIQFGVGELDFSKYIHAAFVCSNNKLKIAVDGKFSSSEIDISNLNKNHSYIRFGRTIHYTDTKYGLLGNMHSIRFSNVARYTSNFAPPTKPFNSIDINITNQTKDKIDFNVSKLGQEVINKIEVLVNNQVSKTYTEIGDLTYNIPSNSLSYGEKVIIRVTFDNDYIEEKEFNYKYKIDNLPTSSSLKELIDRQELLTNAIEVQKNNLKSILESKNVEVSDSENKLSILIQKVNEFGDAPPPPLYLYKEGDECISLTGGWKATFTHTNASFTKYSNYMYLNCPNGNGTIQYGMVNTIKDMSLYSNICINYEYSSKASSSTYFQARYTPNQTIETNTIAKYDIESGAKTIKGTKKIPISGLSNNNYLTMYLGGWGSSSAYVKIYEVWLEK